MFWVEMLTCYNLGWLKGIFYNMMNVDHDIFGDIYIYIFVCELMVITRSYGLIGTWRTTQENRATTVYMALA
jgi:hypothetical protein